VQRLFDIGLGDSSYSPFTKSLGFDSDLYLSLGRYIVSEADINTLLESTDRANHEFIERAVIYYYLRAQLSGSS